MSRIPEISTVVVSPGDGPGDFSPCRGPASQCEGATPSSRCFSAREDFGARPAWLRRIEAFFVRQRERLVWVHAAMFVFFLAVLFVPLFLPDPPGSATPLSHFTTFANYAMWGLWFPLVFLSVIFTGRSWCGLLCPMGAASEWANRHGLQRAIPGWLRWEGAPIASFVVVTILGQTLGVRDHPEAIALVFGGTMLLAIVVGFVYGRNKRAWCRHACPIGLLLGIFSRLGAVQFAPKRPKPGGDAWTEKGVCPTMIDLARKEESRHCIECFRCVNPDSRGGLHLLLRRPGREVEDIRTHHPNPAEVAFLFLGTGLVLGGFLWLVLPSYQALRHGVGAWFIEHDLYWIGESGPWWLMSVHPERREVFNWLDFFMIVGYMAAWMAAVTALLAFTTLVASWLAGRLGADRSLRERFVELGYQYAPVAMFSLVIGLGGELFVPLEVLMGEAGVVWLKGGLFVAGLAWSLWLGNRILAGQGLGAVRRIGPLLPGAVGSLAIGLAWWPAIL